MISPGKRTRDRRAGTIARLETLESRQLLATFSVTNANDSGAGSLRAAILSSNAASGASTIDFAIPGTGVQSIALLSALPTTINPITIDATSQPGYVGIPLVEIEGASILDTTQTPPTAIPDVNGLTLSGGFSTVKGLVVDRFTGSGIVATRDDNTIQSDYVGVDPTGMEALGNGGSGVAVSGRNNLIGSIPEDLSPAVPPNLIGGNGGAGVYLGGSGSSLPTNNIVTDNLIGTNVGMQFAGAPSRLDLGNAGPGIDVESSNNTIGMGGYGNYIAYNGGPGVQVGNASFLSNVIDNRIEHDFIFSNVGLGIDLGGDGVTPNNAAYTFGPNNRQVFPVLTSAFVTGSGAMVQGSLNASPNTAYTVDFYANGQPDRTGYGQGEIPILSKTFVTNASGFVDLTSYLPFSGTLPLGQYLTATATDPRGNSSEFAQDQVVTATAESDLSVTAAQFPGAPTQAGQPNSYTYFAQNNGPATATNVLFSDVLPTGATLVSGTFQPSGTLGSAGAQQSLPAPTNGVIQANFGTLASGQEVAVTLTFTVPTAGTTTNKVGVTSDEPDPAPLNNSLNQTITVTAASPVDLNIYGTANPYPVQVGENLTYTFIVSNDSFNPATGVLFSDPLPDGVAFVSVKSSQGVAVVVGNNVMVALGNLAGGSNASVTVVAKPLISGSLVNTAMVNGNESDFDVINNESDVFSYVTPPPAVDVAVNISGAPYPATVGQPFLYVITVGNPGSAPATNVTLNDILPTAAAIASVRTSEGAYTLAGNLLTVDFGSLPIGGLEEVTVALFPGAPGLITDQASVAANQPEFNISNNFATAVTPVAAAVIAPSVLTQNLIVAGNKITGVVLTFNEDMDPNSASMIANYALFDLGSNGSLSATGKNIPISSANYSTVTRSVTLSFKSGLSIGRFYKIVANGPGSPGLVDVNGNVLDGENNGLQNSIYESLIARGTKTRPVELQVGVPKPKPTAKPVSAHKVAAHKVAAKSHK